MPPDTSFDELIRRVGNGDEEAAAQLVRDFEPVIRRVLRACLRDGRARREFDSMEFVRIPGSSQMPAARLCTCVPIPVASGRRFGSRVFAFPLAARKPAP